MSQGFDFNNKLILTNVPSYFVTDDSCTSLIMEARAVGAGSVLVGPSSLASIQAVMDNTKIRTAVTICYPSGTSLPAEKAYEITDVLSGQYAIDELFVVLAVGKFLGGETDFTRKELEAIKNAAGNTPICAVIEAAPMSYEQKVSLCQLLTEYGITSISASTAFEPYGVPVPDAESIRELRQAAGSSMHITAFGHYKSPEAAMSMLDAGADDICMPFAPWLCQ